MSRKRRDKTIGADYSIFTPDYKKVFDGFELFSIFGWTVGLHRFVGADAPGCFHSHLGVAYRLVLWGGYVEEVLRTPEMAWIARDDLSRMDYNTTVEAFTYKRTFFPGRFGKITHDFEHRIDRLLGKTSWSLWIRGPVTHEVNTRGC